MAQAAKRIIEREKDSVFLLPTESDNLPKMITKFGGKFCKIMFKTFSLAPNDKDRWFLTNEHEVIALQSAKLNGSTIQILGRKIKCLTNFFTAPFSSCHLNIYAAELDFESNEKFFSTTDIKCKMIGLKTHNSGFVFMPLLHTSKLCIIFFF